MTSKLVQALSRLAGNRHSDGVSSLVSQDDRTAIIDGCYELMLASRLGAPPQPQMEPVAWLRPGEHVPIQGCPFGAMWISDKDDPRAFPVYAAQTPSQEADRQ